jgi:hypothetical protein
LLGLAGSASLDRRDGFLGHRRYVVVAIIESLFQRGECGAGGGPDLAQRDADREPDRRLVIMQGFDQGGNAGAAAGPIPAIE